MTAPLWYPALRAWAKQQPKMLLGALAAVLLFVGWILYVPPLLGVRRASAEWRQLQSDLEQDRAILDFAWRRRIQPLPGTRSLARVLEQLHAHARKSDIGILLISPAPASGGGPDAPAILPVELQVEGEYKALGLFLGSLQVQPGLGVVTVKRFQITREDRILPRLKAHLVLEIAMEQGKEA